MIVVFIDDVYDNHFRRTWTLPTQFRHGHGGGRQARKVDVDGGDGCGRWETRRPMRRLLISHHDTTEFLSVGYMRDLWYCAGWGIQH